MSRTSEGDKRNTSYQVAEGSRVSNYKPGFSFGARLPSSESRGHVGPGPGAYDITKRTSTGADRPPAYTMTGRRTNELQQAAAASLPGPGSYAPEQHPFPMAPRPPAWKIVGRESAPEKQSQKPRSSTANTAPGPGRYVIPSTIGRNSQDTERAPAYTIGGKLPFNDFTTDYAKTPGPAAYAVPSASRTKDKPPSYSIIGRTSQDITQLGPGPAQYNPGIDSVRGRAPKYSFGNRHTPHKAFVPPNPELIREDDPLLM